MSKIHFPYNYIAIEGNIGSGKTTFCRMLAQEYSCQLVLEEFDDNPFLPFFYEDPERFAFTVELFFMTERYKQMQRSLLNRDMFVDFTVADYAFIKTLLFARQNLPEEEYRLFQKMFAPLHQTFPKPELLVYFHQVQNSYFEYFRNILSYPILIIDLNTIDFEQNERNYSEVKHLLSKRYNPGVHRVTLVV